MICSDPVENIIISSLATWEMLKIIQIKDLLERKWQILSISQTYRKIKKLLDTYILVKKGSLYEINKLWINSMSNLLEKHKRHNKTISYNLEAWQRKRIYANNLHELDILRSDTVFWLTKHQKYQAVYSYDSHAYHILRNFEMEDNIYGRFLEDKWKAYFILWNDTILDQFASKLIQQGKSWHYTQVTIKEDIFPKEWYTLVIIWEYILEIFYPENITNFFNHFFYGVTDSKDFDNDLYSSIYIQLYGFIP